MKRLLIITYYWPPMGGGGVQRWLKFSRYLRHYGWEPVIYTPSNADVANMDDSLLSDVPENLQVIKRPIWEPFDLYKKLTGKSKDEKVQPGFLQESQANPGMQKISVWIRGNLFIPDAKRFWIKPSVRFLTSYLKKNKIDAVISTGPPHSNHMIAMALKRKTGIKWLADFRDPWTNIDYYDKLMLTKWADKRHHSLEKKVLHSADRVVTVSWSWADDFYKSTGIKPHVVTNGFDPADFDFQSDRKQNDKLTLTHIGSLNKDRNPLSLWKALSLLIGSQINLEQKLRIKLIGPTDISVFEETRKYNLEAIVEHIQHLPHKEVLKEVRNADVLLLPLNNTPNISGVVPGKLYEYLASLRPILCIGSPEGDSARIIKMAEAGKVFDFTDVDGIKACLADYLNLHAGSGLRDNITVPDQFSRKYLAGEIARLLDEI